VNRLLRVAFIASLVFAGNAFSQSAEGQLVTSFSEGGTAGSNDTFKISERDLPSMEQKALDGDGRIAGKLSLYFGGYLNDPEQQKYWLQVAAEDDLPGAEYEFGQRLYVEKNTLTPDKALGRDLSRACFWVKKAIAHGYRQYTPNDEMHEFCHIK